MSTNYTFEDGLLRVKTPKGDILVQVSTDPVYPGVYIYGTSPDPVNPIGKKETHLALIEYQPREDALQASVWSDGQKPDPTHLIKYENVGKELKMTFSKLQETDDYNFYTVTITGPNNKQLCYDYKVCRTCAGEITKGMVLQSIAADYELYLSSPTIDDYRGNVGDTPNIENSYNELKKEVSKYTDVFGKDYLDYLIIAYY